MKEQPQMRSPRGPKKSSAELAAYGLLDKLLFAQQLVHLSPAHEIRDWMRRLTAAIDSAVAAAGYQGVDAQIAKHSVVVVLDVLRSFQEVTAVDLAKADAEDSADGAAAFFVQDALAANMAISDDHSIAPFAVDLGNALRSMLAQAPLRALNRLYLLQLAEEIEEAPLHALMWLCRGGVVSTKNTKPSDEMPPSSDESVVRLGLLQQYEMWRSTTSQVWEVSSWLPDSLLTTLQPGTSCAGMASLLEYRAFYQRRHEEVKFLGGRPPKLWFFPELQDNAHYLQAFFQSCGDCSHHINRLVNQKADLVATVGASWVMVLRRRGSSIEAACEDGAETLRNAGFTYSADSLRRKHWEVAKSIEATIQTHNNLMAETSLAMPFYLADLYYLWAVLESK